MSDPTDPDDEAPLPAPADGDPKATARGAILIVAAVLVGVLLLFKGVSQEGGVFSTEKPTLEKTATSSTTTTTAVALAPEETTTTTAAPKPPAEVTVMVANASGKAGVAGATSTKLKSAGYTKVDTVTAPTLAKTSAVYYSNGAQADAQGVAKVLGLDAATVAALPSPAPVDPKGASVLVVIGADKA